MLEGDWIQDEETALEGRRSRDAGGVVLAPRLPTGEHSQILPRGGDPELPSHSSQKQVWVGGGGAGERCGAGVGVRGCISKVGAQRWETLPSPQPSSLACADCKSSCSFCSPDASEAANPALAAPKKWKMETHRVAMPPRLLESF